MLLKPKLSVCIRAHNQERFIAQAIESVLMQATGLTYEMVIGEDCSSDATRQIAEDYQRKFPGIIRLVLSDRNMGKHINLDRILDACRGEYVAFLDGDDYWTDEKKIDTQISMMEGNPDVGMVHAAYVHCYGHSGEKMFALTPRRRHEYARERDVFGKIVIDNYDIGACTVCARKECIDEARFMERAFLTDPQLLIDDLPLWLYIAHRWQVAYLDREVAAYRILPVSASHFKTREARIAYKEESRRIRAYFAHKYSSDKGLQSKAQEGYCLCLIESAFISADKNQMRSVGDSLLGQGYRLPFLQRVLYAATITPRVRPLAEFAWHVHALLYYAIARASLLYHKLRNP